MKYTILLACTVLLLLIPLLNTFLALNLSDWTYFLIVVLGAIFLNGCTLFIITRNLKNLFFQHFYLIFILLSLFWLTFYHILAADTDNPYGGFGLPYDLHSLKFYWLWLVPSFVIITLYPLFKYFDTKIERAKPNYLVETNSSRKAVVFVFFLFNLIYLFGNINVEIPIISYIGRVGHNSSLLFLFWIGYWNRRLGLLFYLTMLLVSTIVVFELLSGGRYGPFLTGVLLFLGFYFHAAPSARSKLRILAFILFPFIVIMAGFLDNLRQIVGRGDLEDVSLERIEMISQAIDRVDEIKKIVGVKQSAFVAGLARNVNWVDVAVVSLTDKKVPFRRNKNLATEIDNIISLTLFSSGGSTRTVIERAKLDKYERGLGSAPARRYGFSVNNRTSVEWGLLSDGYSRGGHVIYYLYLTIFLLMLSFSETFIKVVNRNQVEQKFLLCVFLYIIIKSNALPLYEIIREFILNGSFYLFVIIATRFLTGRRLFN